MKTVGAQVGRWAGLFVLWVALVGTRQPLELLAGGVAAVAATVATGLVLRLRLPSPFRGARSWRLAGRAVAQIVPDAVAVLASARRRRGGTFGVAPLGAGPDWRRSAERGIAAWGASLAPNTIVVDVDEERRVALYHCRVRRGGEPLA